MGKFIDITGNRYGRLTVEHLGIKHKTLLARINDYKWPIEKALTQKVKLWKKK